MVKDNEQDPPKTIIRGEPTQYVVKKIKEKKKVQNKIYYKVEWKGHPGEDSWEPNSTLKKSKYIKKLIQDFENDL